MGPPQSCKMGHLHCPLLDLLRSIQKLAGDYLILSRRTVDSGDNSVTGALHSSGASPFSVPSSTSDVPEITCDDKTRRYTFDSTGIRIQSEDASSDCKWSLYQRGYESPSVFIFSLTSYHATYIPKRCFASSDDIARVRDLIRENMPGRWRLRRT
jgi:YcxB-like protein